MSKSRSGIKLVRVDEDDEAISIQEIILTNLDSIYSTALRLTKNKNDAEDLVQETCLKAFKNSEQISSNNKAKSWVFRILMNTFINSYRKKIKEPPLVDIELSHLILDHVVTVDSLNPEEIALNYVLDGEIKEALDGLHVDFRTVIWLSDVEGFTYQEIQEMLDCPIGTIASRLFRARSLLRETLFEYAKKRGVI
ncbi:MAG: sigma-70 family RNA polymerase sigma factor [Thermodesulfobacteriota bacterium]